MICTSCNHKLELPPLSGRIVEHEFLVIFFFFFLISRSRNRVTWINPSNRNFSRLLSRQISFTTRTVEIRHPADYGVLVSRGVAPLAAVKVVQIFIGRLQSVIKLQ